MGLSSDRIMPSKPTKAATKSKKTEKSIVPTRKPTGRSTSVKTIAKVKTNDKFWLKFHTEWSKWNKSGSKDHEVLGPFRSKKAAVKAAEEQIESAMGGCSFGCEITEEIIETDNRKNPPDDGDLLVVEDSGDYQTHFVEITKCRKKPFCRGDESSDSVSEEDEW